ELVKDSKGAPMTLVVERDGHEITFENLAAREAGDLAGRGLLRTTVRRRLRWSVRAFGWTIP
ncbi:MAG: hypothetical protein IKZ84_18985, partial [Victivallales bacterium]|nr:hypothetical protein [Victivallales bacterium]